LLAEVREGSNSSHNSDEQLLSIHLSSAESVVIDAFVSSRALPRCVWFVDRTSESPSIDEFDLGSGEVVISGEVHYCSSLFSLHFCSTYVSPCRPPPRNPSPYLCPPLPAPSTRGLAAATAGQPANPWRWRRTTSLQRRWRGPSPERSPGHSRRDLLGPARKPPGPGSHREAPSPTRTRA
jgi:hypothetical protein